LFCPKDDRAKGFYELITRARVASLPDEIYQVAIDALKLLENQQFAFRRATDEEVKLAHDQVRNPTHA
jgi:hypothetical protein